MTDNNVICDECGFVTEIRREKVNRRCRCPICNAGALVPLPQESPVTAGDERPGERDDAAERTPAFAFAAFSLGVVLAGYFAVVYEAIAPGTKVYNIGLIADRLAGLMVGLALATWGIIFIAARD